MSIRLMTRVWDSPYARRSPSRLLVMLKLADHASDEGICFPAQKMIAEKCGMSSKTVMRIIGELVTDNLLSIESRYKLTNIYTLHFDRLDLENSQGTQCLSRDNSQGTQLVLQEDTSQGTSCVPPLIVSKEFNHQKEKESDGVAQPSLEEAGIRAEIEQLRSEGNAKLAEMRVELAKYANKFDPVNFNRWTQINDEIGVYMDSMGGKIQSLRESIMTEEEKIEELFENWKTVLDKPRSRLDTKRRAFLKKALQTYDLQFLKDIPKGVKNSKWHLDNHQTSIELLYRDSDHMERYHEFFLNPPKRPLTEFEKQEADALGMNDDQYRELRPC